MDTERPENAAAMPGAFVPLSSPAPAPSPDGAEDASDASFKRRWPKRLVIGIIAAVAALGLAAYMVHLAGGRISGDGYISPYNWGNLTTDEKGRLHYTDDEGNPASLVGIDVSEWDTDTDWAAVAADGIDYVMIRVGYRGSTAGGIYEDNLFEYHYQGAKDNGLLVGLYFFSEATSAAEGREEAERVLEILDGRPLDLPICFDHESYSDPEGRAFGITDAQYSAATQAFCNRIEHAGYVAGIYGNRYAIAKLSAEVRDMYTVWLAEWDTDLPHAQFDFTFWQFTNAGHVDGMWRRVDTSIWFLNEVPIKTPESRAAAEEDALDASEADAPEEPESEPDSEAEAESEAESEPEE